MIGSFFGQPPNVIYPYAHESNISQVLTFIPGKRSEDAENVDWIPTIFEHNKEQAIKVAKKKIKRKQRHENIQRKRARFDESFQSEASQCAIPDLGEEEQGVACISSEIHAEQDDSFMEISRYKEIINSLQRELKEKKDEIDGLKGLNEANIFGFNKIKVSDKLIQFYTGLPTRDVFEWVCNLCDRKVKSCHSSLSTYDHVLLVLMKLRLGLLNMDLAERFGIPVCTVSKVFRIWLPALSSYMRELIIWPERSTIRQNLPHSFTRKFRDCVCIIDCSEIFIERPKNLTARAQTWSSYKHNNTCKYLIGISPAGAVMFLSHGWGGRVSDKQITQESGFLNKVTVGDCILADRGFLIEDELNEKGAILKIPRFTKGKSQLSAQEVDESRQLAHVRIHVERVIGRLKDYRILQTVIPISQVDLIDDIMTVICGAINLNKSVVSR